MRLKDAVDAGKVIVTERERHGEDRAQVNALFIENISSDTVFILSGEIVTGGKQDRMVRTDVVLAPHSDKVDLSVYCVEAGRWEGESNLFMMVENSLAPNEVRQSAIKGADQKEVWDKVEVQLEAKEVLSESSRMLDVRSAVSEDAIRDYVEKLSGVFRNKSNIVGVVAVSGNDAIGCDLFATHELFEQHFPNLLQSYAWQANTGDVRSADPERVGNYWRRVMITVKKDGGFLRTKDQIVRKKDPAHFSMVVE